MTTIPVQLHEFITQECYRDGVYIGERRVEITYLEKKGMARRLPYVAGWTLQGAAYAFLVDYQVKQTIDRKSTRLNSSHVSESRMPSSA